MKNRKYKMISRGRELWDNYYGMSHSNDPFVTIYEDLFNEASEDDSEEVWINSKTGERLVMSGDLPKGNRIK